MGKNSDNTNYTMNEIDRLMDLVEQALPLGRDEWERLGANYNAGRARGSPEREAQEAIDDKANVVELDDDADDDDRDERPVEPDFSFEPDPEDFFEDGDDEGMRLVPEPSVSGLDDSFGGTESLSSQSSTSANSASRGEFQDLLAAPLTDG
ncbi:hypothetical protein F444_21642 [Phytophthora nicotianae P1976]|uniref:DUF6818 domain-containing protein n=1 Tax=Phytophthora nicotianae P1976 TaxID=1317066 RepID=A0A080Z0G7_PHYNI|nr:hypothetical protein F444_21642 [Phytophthora nicotianae P1976]